MMPVLIWRIMLVHFSFSMVFVFVRSMLSEVSIFWKLRLVASMRSWILFVWGDRGVAVLMVILLSVLGCVRVIWMLSVRFRSDFIGRSVGRSCWICCVDPMSVIRCLFELVVSSVIIRWIGVFGSILSFVQCSAGYFLVIVLSSV